MILTEGTIENMKDRTQKNNRLMIPSSSLYFWLSMLIICTSAWSIQNSIFISWDISILLHETQKLLAGGTYVNDYFETSPPMILYLYILPVLVTKIFPVSIMTAFRGSVFFLGIGSVITCKALTKRLFYSQDRMIGDLFLLVLAALFLILPFYELGQKEHLLFIFSMPYILAASLWIEEKKINRAFAVGIGLMAGLGFAIKPFFVMTPLCIELYIIFKKKNILAGLRPETLTILMVLGVYTLLALHLHADYFKTVVPYALRLYYSSMDLPWGKIMFHPVNMFCYFAIFFYILQYKYLAYKEFSGLLCCALVSFIIIFVMQRFTPFYHLLPPLALAILLLFFLFSQIASQPSLDQKQGLWLLLFGSFYFYFLAHGAGIKWFNYLLFPLLAPIAWGFFALLFTLLFILVKRKISLKIVGTVALIVGISYPFSCSTLSMASQHPLSTTLVCLLTLLTLFIGKTPLPKGAVLGLAMLGFGIFFYPIYFLSSEYFYALDYKQGVRGLVEYMKTQIKHQSIYLFSTESNYIFPVIDYAEVASVSRFPYFWMLPALVKNEKRAPDISLQNLEDKNFLIRMIVQDLNKHKPDFVFIDVKKHKTNMNFKNFTYLKFFATHPDFQQAWKCYHYVASIHGNENNLIFSHYHFDIYQRDFCRNNL